MTWTDLASITVDHHPPHHHHHHHSNHHNHQSLGTIGKLSLSQQHLSSRPGTPIVTPRTTLPLANHLPVSRPVSRLTDLQAAPEEEEEVVAEVEELEEEEEEEEEEDNNGGVDHCEDLGSTLSGLSLSSNSGSDTLPPLPAPSTPPTSSGCSFLREEEDKAVHSKGTCLRNHLRTASRALTAASTSYRTRHSKYCNCSSTHHSIDVTMVDAKVIYASSYDPKFPPAAIMDGRQDTFWASSGLYPQFLVVSLPNLTAIDNVYLVAYNVRKLSVARSIKSQPTDFEEISQEELDHTEGKLQETPILSENVSAIHLRITIEEGYNHFCSVFSISVVGAMNPSYGGGGMGGGSKQLAPPIRKDHPSLSPSHQNVTSVNSTPMYHRPQSPVQVMSKPPQVTMVGRADGADDDDDADNYDSTRLFDHDEDEF